MRGSRWCQHFCYRHRSHEEFCDGKSLSWQKFLPMVFPIKKDHQPLMYLLAALRGSAALQLDDLKMVKMENQRIALGKEYAAVKKPIHQLKLTKPVVISEAEVAPLLPPCNYCDCSQFLQPGRGVWNIDCSQYLVVPLCCSVFSHFSSAPACALRRMQFLQEQPPGVIQVLCGLHGNTCSVMEHLLL